MKTNKKDMILLMAESNFFRFGCVILAITLCTSFGGEPEKVQSAQQQAEFSILPFGENGVFKMLYDRRMRPQAVCMDETVYIVFNQGVGGNV